MKSKLIRVKVWYEHAEAAPADEIKHDLEEALSRAFNARKDDTCGAVTVRQVDVGEVSGHQVNRRPEPDF